MNSSLKCGDKVKLITFHNMIEPPKDIDERENYWRLIGSIGKIISNKKKIHPAFLEMGERVLVEFDNLEKYGLYSHNERPNSLWIFISDIVSI